MRERHVFMRPATVDGEAHHSPVETRKRARRREPGMETVHCLDGKLRVVGIEALQDIGEPFDLYPYPGGKRAELQGDTVAAQRGVECMLRQVRYPARLLRRGIQTLSMSPRYSRRPSISFIPSR